MNNAINPSRFREKKKEWRFPKPKINYNTQTSSQKDSIVVFQQKFYDEYHPSGHAINSQSHFPDIPLIDENGKIFDYHKVNRKTVPFQKDSITIILAHLLGNKTELVESAVKKGSDLSESVISEYREIWSEKNMEVMRYELIKSILATGDGACIFYMDENKELRWKVLSFLNGDEFYRINDKFGNLSQLARFYTAEDGENDVEFCDVYTNEDVVTFKFAADKKEWVEVETVKHNFMSIPVVYYYRKDGAFWTPAQPNIDNIEVLLSRVSEDNRTKAKGKYHLATSDPESVETQQLGDTDIIITKEGEEFSLINGADLSGQFEFEYDTELETIQNSLGIVFPKSKSSGDMPTGSMKMIFYPTERVVSELIIEFNGLMDEINKAFKNGVINEYKSDEISNKLIRKKISASIRMFTPQDDASIATMLGQAKSYGTLSDETILASMPLAANNEKDRMDAQIKKEKEEELMLQAQENKNAENN